MDDIRDMHARSLAEAIERRQQLQRKAGEQGDRPAVGEGNPTGTVAPAKVGVSAELLSAIDQASGKVAEKVADRVMATVGTRIEGVAKLVDGLTKQVRDQRVEIDALNASVIEIARRPMLDASLAANHQLEIEREATKRVNAMIQRIQVMDESEMVGVGEVERLIAVARAPVSVASTPQGVPLNITQPADDGALLRRLASFESSLLGQLRKVELARDEGNPFIVRFAAWGVFWLLVELAAALAFGVQVVMP